jgi:membrane protein implicated in regulation of membrane protease activity
MEFGVALGLGMLVFGILMILAELAAPGAFILVPATVLIFLGVIGMVAPDILLSWWSPALAVIILLPMTFVTMKLYQKLAPPAPPETTVATSLVGRKGVVEHEVAPHTLTGKVRIEHDTWSATADVVIPVGRNIIVKSSEGVHVKVEETK